MHVPRISYCILATYREYNRCVARRPQCDFLHCLTVRKCKKGMLMHMLRTTVFVLAVFPLASTHFFAAHAEEHLVHPGESPQAKLDQASAGDRLVFLPGVHQHGLGQHRSLLYVAKPIEIELREGATLKLADHTTSSSKRPKSPPIKMRARSWMILR